MRTCFATFVILASLTTSPALTDDCSPNATGVDVCEFAQKAQAELASSLPMRLNKNMTLHSASAIGRRVTLAVIWDQTWAEVEQKLRGAGVSMADYTKTMDQMSMQFMCGQEETAAFIRLGGIWDVSYRTIDFHPIHTTSIEACS